MLGFAEHNAIILTCTFLGLLYSLYNAFKLR
jgi:hypothetical protein